MRQLSLTLKGAKSSMAVKTDLLSILPGKKYSFSWAQKCIGDCGFEIPCPRNDIEKVKFEAIKDYLLNFGNNSKYFWEKLTDFTGIELRFMDKEKKTVSQKRFPFYAETHLGLIGTEKWRDYLKYRNDTNKFMTQCAINFEAPENAGFCQAAFIIEPRIKINAGMIFDKIELTQLGLGKKKSLSLFFRDSETKKPLSARASLTNSKGNAFLPENCIKNNEPKPFFYCMDGKVELDLPSGKYTLEAVKGFKYLPLKKEIEIQSDSKNDFEFELQKGFDVKKDNWLNGDHHLHICGHAAIDYPLMTPLEALKAAEAEGMDYIPFQAEFMDSLTHKCETMQNGSSIAQYSCELVNHIWGHYCCILGNESLKRQICGHILYPTMLHAVREINASGGYCIAAHPYGMICNPSGKEDKFRNMAEGVGNPGRWNCAKELPLILLHGEKCAYDLLASDNINELEFGINEYYRLLNFGFKIPVGGSTDTGINSANSSFPGCRTFVKTDELSFKSIANGFRSGKTFASNGPLITASIDGNFEWGDTLIKKAEEKINIRLKAFSPWGLDSCRIICNGKTIETKNIKGQSQAEWETEIKANTPGWLSVAVDGPKSKWHKNRQIAHSSPVYLKDPNNPFKPSKELSDYYGIWLTQLEKIANHYKEEKLESDAKKTGLEPADAWNEIITNLEKARKKLEEISEYGWI